MMSDDNKVVSAFSLEDNWLPLERLAALCGVEPEWLRQHIREGFFRETGMLNGTWRFSGAMFSRVRRIREMEDTFDADPELAALVADMQEEIERLRHLVRRLAL